MRIEINLINDGEVRKHSSTPKKLYSRKRLQEFIKECEDEMFK